MKPLLVSLALLCAPVAFAAGEGMLRGIEPELSLRKVDAVALHASALQNRGDGLLEEALIRAHRHREARESGRQHASNSNQSAIHLE